MWVAVECHVMVYDIDTLELQGMWQAHDSPISAMVATPEGVWIGFESGELSVWVTNVRATHSLALSITRSAPPLTRLNREETLHAKQPLRLTRPWSHTWSGSATTS